MKILDLFAGIGGFSLAAHWMGWRTVAFVEKDEFCQKVLRKNFKGVPIYGDIREFSAESFRGRCDIITGGFPCQPFSIAGQKKGRDDDRFLFPEMLRIISEVRPRWVVAENVRGILNIESGDVFEEICSQLESTGYEVQSFCIPACAVDAPHRRDRIWFVAHASDAGLSRARCESQPESAFVIIGDNFAKEAAATSDDDSRTSRTSRQSQNQRRSTDAFSCDCKSFTSNASSQRCEEIEYRPTQKFNQNNYGTHTDAESPRLERRGIQRAGFAEYNTGRSSQWDENWIEVATRFCRVDARISNRVDRLRALGNSIVPQIAFEIFKAIEAAEKEIENNSQIGLTLG